MTRKMILEESRLVERKEKRRERHTYTESVCVRETDTHTERTKSTKRDIQEDAKRREINKGA